MGYDPFSLSSVGYQTHHTIAWLEARDARACYHYFAGELDAQQLFMERSRRLTLAIKP
jgi:hypothetical protein